MASAVDPAPFWMRAGAATAAVVVVVAAGGPLHARKSQPHHVLPFCATCTATPAAAALKSISPLLMAMYMSITPSSDCHSIGGRLAAVAARSRASFTAAFFTVPEAFDIVVAAARIKSASTAAVPVPRRRAASAARMSCSAMPLILWLFSTRRPRTTYHLIKNAAMGAIATGFSASATGSVKLLVAVLLAIFGAIQFIVGIILLPFGA